MAGRAALFAITDDDVTAIGEEDFEYLLGWFEDFGPFWPRAAAAGRAVIFTVDQ